MESTAVRAALNKTGSALAALTVLKKICDHPTLLNERAASLVARAGTKQFTTLLLQNSASPLICSDHLGCCAEPLPVLANHCSTIDRMRMVS